MSFVVAALLVQTQRLTRAAFKLRSEADENRQRFDAFMSNTPAVTFIKDAAGRMVYINEAYCRQFQTSLEAVIGRTGSELWPAEYATQVASNDREVLSGNQGREFIESRHDASGELRTFLSLKFPFVNSAGERLLGGVAFDITDHKRAEEALRFSQFSIDRSPDLVFWMDARGAITYANRAACRKLQYDRDELLGMNIRSIDFTLTEALFLESRRQLKKNVATTCETVYRTREGKVFPVEMCLNYLEFDGQEFSCSMSRDITERKRAEEELFHHARYDALTGLLNRRLFEIRLEQCVARSREAGEPLTVFYLDLDGFKLVNDTLGHAVGDAMLKEVASRLKRGVHEADTLARMGGDEFTLLSPEPRTQSEAVSVACQLLTSLSQPFELAGREVLVSASIGVSRFPQDGNNGSALLQSADAAMYEAKHKGKNQVQFFTPQLGAAARERMEIENDLRHAVERRELELHYQPQICLRTGEIVRYESLLRWNHPQLGLLQPSRFIPIAEERLSIVPIGAWVLEEACRAARKWRRDSCCAPGVAVNISAVQFGRTDFFDTVSSTLRQTGLEPQCLELELTETVLMQSLDEFAENIARFHALGVRLAIDDFGAGYSSFRYLQKLPFDVMKIDSSFVQAVDRERKALSLVRAMVTLAHSLDMKVVMEGIETPGQMAAISEAGCDFGQGYLLGRPQGELSHETPQHATVH